MLHGQYFWYSHFCNFGSLVLALRSNGKFKCRLFWNLNAAYFAWSLSNISLWLTMTASYKCTLLKISTIKGHDSFVNKIYRICCVFRLANECFTHNSLFEIIFFGALTPFSITIGKKKKTAKINEKMHLKGDRWIVLLVRYWRYVG